MINTIHRDTGHVLLIADATQPGGLGTHLVHLTTAATHEGWAVFVLLEDGVAADTITAPLRQAGAAIMRGPLYRTHPSQSIQESVENAVAQARPDVVHVHCGSPRSAILPRELSIEKGLPLVFTEHFVSTDLDISSEDRSRIDVLYRRAYAVVSVCEQNRRVIRYHFGFQADRHEVIRNGVRVFPERTAAFGKGGVLSAITVARLVPQKGIDILLHAVASLPVGLRVLMRFTLVGGGELETTLRQLGRRLGVTDRLAFVGWCDDVPCRLQSHDLFILPSRAEGEPIALLEALAAGLPCIASAVSGIPETLGQGKYGYLVPPNDPCALAKAIASFAEAPHVLRHKAYLAKEHLVTNYNLDANLQQVIRLWEAARTQSLSTSK